MGPMYLREFISWRIYQWNRVWLSKINRLKPKDNISKVERTALQGLKNNMNLVMMPIDKGKAYAVVSRQQYIAEAKRQLSAFHYKKVEADMTHETAILVDDLVEDLFDNEYIDTHVREYLSPSNQDIKTPTFYFLAKAHKVILRKTKTQRL